MDQFEIEAKAAEANQSVFGYETFVPYFDEEEDCCGGDHHHHHHDDGCDCGHDHDGDCGHGHGHHHDGDCDCEECDGDCDCEDCGDECCGAHRHWHNPPFSTFTFEHDDLSYFVRCWGKPSQPAVLLLHGFMQTSDSWWTVAPALAQDHCVYAMDLLGHGQSDKPADPSRYTLEEAADAAAQLISQVILPAAKEAAGTNQRQRTHVVGYSLGGRVALGLMDRCASDLNCLVLESASLGPATPEDREAFADRSCEWARVLEEEGMEAFVDMWEQLPLFATQQPMGATRKGKAIRAERLSQDPKAMAKVVLGMGQQRMPLKDEAKEMLACTWNPICYLYGGRDEKYAEQAHDFLHEGYEAIGVMAGHNIHLENPERYVETLSRVLRGNEMRGL